MSSLAATQADGYYLPPSYFTSNKYKTQSVSKFQNSKGHNQYIQNGVVRFELPFDGFCHSCDNHVGKGTRFNAKKTECGKYFTTTIWEFRMTCRACAKCTFVVRTDPKGRTFEYVDGIKKKVEEWDVVEAGSLGIVDTDVGSGLIKESSTSTTMVAGGIGLLEKRAQGERKAMTERERMEGLMRWSGETRGDDAAKNANLRSMYRKKRKDKRKRVDEAKRLGLGGGIEVADTTTDGERFQAIMAFEDSHARAKKVKSRETQAFLKLRSGSIFDSRRKSGGKKSRLTTTAALVTARDGGTKDYIESKLPSHAIRINPSKDTPTVENNSMVGESSLSALCDYASDSDSS